MNLIAGMILAPAIVVAFLTRARLYNTVIRYLSIKTVMRLCVGIAVGMALWGAWAIWFLDDPFPRSVAIIASMNAVMGLVGVRMLARYLVLRHAEEIDVGDVKNTVIFGAGAAGVQILWSLSHTTSAFRPVAFVDDDPKLIGQEKGGLVIYSRDAFERLVSKLGVSDVLFAVPSASRVERNDVIDWLEQFPVKVRTLPSIDQLVLGDVRIDDIREVEVSDLLGRDPVPPVPELMAHCIQGKCVMVTGAGGSIGSELCRQIVREKPRALVLFELSEFALYTIYQELQALCRELAFSFPIIDVTGSIQNRELLEQTIVQFGIHTLYHAAAYKHVPIVEHNMAEGVRNNIFGTWNVADIAGELGVRHVVLISSDKAVRPTNVMGATKRVAEMILQALDSKYAGTVFSMVRFGNVLGSSGSVVPLFRQQIKAGGPVTVTHRDMTRYFMTINEAACLVIQAGAMANGGDVFVLDMGDPVNIYQLAVKMVRLSGFEVRQSDSDSGDIDVIFTGLRPGEKLFEELLIGKEVSGAEHPKIMRAQEDCLSLKLLRASLEELQAAADRQDHGRMHRILARLVDGYRPKERLVDHFASTDQLPFLAEVVILPVTNNESTVSQPPLVE